MEKRLGRGETESLESGTKSCCGQVTGLKGSDESSGMEAPSDLGESYLGRKMGVEATAQW